MRPLKVSPVVAIVFAFGCGGSQPPADAPAGDGAPVGGTAADKTDEPPAGGGDAPAGGAASGTQAKAVGGGGASAGGTATGKPAKPAIDACNALLDHIQSVSTEAIDREGMRDACMNQWPEAQINCFKAARDDAAIEACWPKHK